MGEDRIDADLVLQCARDLIAAPSENPPGDERAVAAVAERYARDAGLDVEVIETAPNRLNVIATLDSGRPGRTLAWNGHIDVVPVGDPAAWKHPPFEAVVDGDILHGRGAADMKGPCAAAIAAAAALKAAGGPAKGKLVLQLVADEEVLGPHGTLALYERGLAGADAAIVGEPTDLDVAVAERGMLWVIARTAGVAAHGSRPELGVSAIEEASRVVLALRALRNGRSHPLLGEPSLNVGTIQGGSKINIVPDACTIAIDRRTLPGETDQGILDEMHAALKAAGASATLEIVHRADPVEVDPNEEIVRAAVASHAAIRGRDATIGAMTGATDAHVLAGKAGIPAIIFGPGSLGQAHTTTEHVSIPDLIDGARIYAHLFGSYLSA